MAVTGGIVFGSVAAGSNHTCGVSVDGVAYCWGFDLNGQLGNGKGGDNPVPGPVETEERFNMLSGGFGHTCGVAVGGAAYCWGRNLHGQLGDGSHVNAELPQKVFGT